MAREEQLGQRVSKRLVVWGWVVWMLVVGGLVVAVWCICVVAGALRTAGALPLQAPPAPPAWRADCPDPAPRRWGDQGFAQVEMDQGLFSDGACGMYRFPLAAPTALQSPPVVP